jgi:hydrogenase-4 component F
MIAALILLPIVAGLAAFGLRPAGARRALLIATGAGHCVLTALAWVHPPTAILDGWLGLDALGLLFLSITSLLFLVVAIYAVGYFRREDWGRRQDFQEGFLFTNAREPTFTCCLLLFLGMMTLVTASQHFGLLWVAVEATTLASAPLIYFHRHRRSLEATWKYIMICSVGIALALLGNFFLAVAATQGRHENIPMLLSSLTNSAGLLHVPWLKAAFLFLLVGYGAKMGLAPMHTWLPDAHSESPSVISALLSGALLNCAFLAILRAQQVCVAAGQGPFGQKLLIGFGLVSMVVAAAFMFGQSDFKRMLAYSSVENMGILSLAVGLGAGGGFGAMLHAVNHSLTKGMLFLVAGNILALYRSKSTREVRGVLRSLPVSGVLWVAGFLAITGSPPFGPFLSELLILKAALDHGRIVVAIVYLLTLSGVFVGMATLVLRMAQGEPSGLPADYVAALPAVSAGSGAFHRFLGERPLAIIPPLVLGASVLLLGLYIPAPLQTLLEQAAKAVAGE